MVENLLFTEEECLGSFVSFTTKYFSSFSRGAFGVLDPKSFGYTDF